MPKEVKNPRGTVKTAFYPENVFFHLSNNLHLFSLFSSFPYDPHFLVNSPFRLCHRIRMVFTAAPDIAVCNSQEAKHSIAFHKELLKLADDFAAKGKVNGWVILALDGPWIETYSSRAIVYYEDRTTIDVYYLMILKPFKGSRKSVVQRAKW